MTRILLIHATHPQARALGQAVACVRGGGIIAYPTDSSYALGCHMHDRAAVEALRRIRKLGRAHNFTLMCSSLSEVAVYARMDNEAYRWVKNCLPGAYTFILRATPETPRRVQNERRRTVGVRIPAHPVTRGLVETMGEPLISTTLQMPGETEPLTDADAIAARLKGQVELVIDAGPCGVDPSTVVDLTAGSPEVLRVGRGPTEPFA